MSQSALSAKVFAIYLFIISSVVVLAPNLLLAIFRIPPTTEVWIHVVGVVVFAIGIYIWIAAKHDIKPILEASVYTRALVFVAFTTFALLGMTSPMIIVFGLVDLAGGVWTYFALQADARSAQARKGSQ